MLADILLVLNIIVAVLLVLVILVQRSEGGMGALGGEGSGALLGGGSSKNPLVKVTVILTAIFLVSSLWLAIETAGDARSTSVVDQPEINVEEDTLTPDVPVTLPSTETPSEETSQ